MEIGQSPPSPLPSPGGEWPPLPRMMMMVVGGAHLLMDGCIAIQCNSVRASFATSLPLHSIPDDDGEGGEVLLTYKGVSQALRGCSHPPESGVAQGPRPGGDEWKAGRTDEQIDAWIWMDE